MYQARTEKEMTWTYWIKKLETSSTCKLPSKKEAGCWLSITCTPLPPIFSLVIYIIDILKTRRIDPQQTVRNYHAHFLMAAYFGINCHIKNQSSKASDFETDICLRHRFFNWWSIYHHSPQVLQVSYKRCLLLYSL
jgi:hypothetical protein